jgi:MscS family membrane protein
MLILVALQNFGISISALLAFGGVGGIAIGFAAKDTIANFLGGLMIFIDRPFAVGEDIRCAEQKIEGKVEHIGWRLTHIRDPESRTLYVPNGLFSTMVVENLTRIKGWRIKSHLPIKIEDLNKVGTIVNEIHQFLTSNPEIDQTQAVAVNLDEIGSYSLNILVLAFSKSTDWFKYLEVQQNVLTEATRIVERNQATLALPIQVNYVQTALEKKGKRQANSRIHHDGT